jgi:hypothetical protein
MRHNDSSGDGEPLVLIHAGVFADWFVPLELEPALAGDDSTRTMTRGAVNASAVPPVRSQIRRITFPASAAVRPSEHSMRREGSSVEALPRKV